VFVFILCPTDIRRLKNKRSSSLTVDIHRHRKSQSTAWHVGNLINQYPLSPEVADDQYDSEEYYQGICKSILYFLLFVAAFVVVAAETPSTVTKQITLNNPQPNDFDALIRNGYAPSCACSSSNVPVLEFSTFLINLDNYCGAPSFLQLNQRYCQLFDDTDACPAYSQSKINTFCNWFSSILNANIAQWNSSSVFTSSVLQISEMQALLDGNANVFQNSVVSDFQRLIGLINMYEISARPITGFGYDYKPTLIYSNNKQSNPTVNNGGYYGKVTDWESAESGKSYGEYFTVNAVNPDSTANKASIAFMLYRKGPSLQALFNGVNNWGGGNCENDYEASATSGCSGFKYYMNHDFARPGFTPYLGPEFMAWMNLTGVSLSSGAVSNGHIKSMNVVINWPKYFTECAPETCVYTSTRPISAITWVGIILGILGGLTTVLKMVVGTVYSIFDWLSSKVISKSCNALSLIVFGSLLNCVNALLNCVVGCWNSTCGCCYQIKDNQVKFPSSEIEMMDIKPVAIKVIEDKPVIEVKQVAIKVNT
jgi:hypothetical protein